MALPYTEWQRIVKLVSPLWETIFPQECLACNQEGSWLCRDCLVNGAIIQKPTCPFCDRTSPLGKTCPPCRSNHALTGARSLYYYQAPLTDFIHSYKYEGVTAANDWISRQLTSLLHELPIPSQTKPLFVPVPTSSDRLRKLGFHPNDGIAKQLAASFTTRSRFLLHRRHGTPSQTSLTREERLQTITQSVWLKHPPFAPYVILVDDVITTGATMDACAHLLKEAGALQVWGLSLARG